MLRTDPAALRQALEELKEATLDHVVWRDQLLRVISGRRPCDPDDLAPDAHHRCQFGQWYFGRALPELRELPSFAMVGAEHEHQHRVAARLLTDLAAGARLGRADIEELEEACARLSFALYFIRREIECAVGSRDSSTDAYSAGEMLRDLREWHALAKQPARQCCIALMELDGDDALDLVHGHQARTQALVTAVKTISAHLRLSDKVFRYEGSKFLIRLSGTDLSTGKTVIARLRDAITRRLERVGADGRASPVSVSFGVAPLDPEVDALESLDRADQALTLAKTAGRNQMICWDPSVTTGVRLRRLEIKEIKE
jgi:diguanylate cyclase (GGDEF)-like protein